MRKLSSRDFIERSIKIHGNLYDYSKTNYYNSWTPVFILCRNHGKFLQIPDNHIHRKSGCPKCCIKQRPQNNPKSTEEFIADAKKIHHNKYDYSNASYTSAKNKIEIVCHLHGTFLQTPNNHLNGSGCPRCRGNRSRCLTTQTFINRAKEVHGEKYDYSLTSYINRSTKIVIICPIHGKFLQVPYAHIKLQGCPKCKKSKGEREIEYFLQKNKIIFESPKSFATCINPSTRWRLYFDFYIPSKNLLIEFDGYQHFRPYYRDKYNLDSLKNRQKRDAFKTEWAEENGISLVRIKYTQIRKIKFILSKFFI